MQNARGRNLLFIIGVVLFIILGLEVFFDFWTELLMSIVGVSPQADTTGELTEFFADSNKITLLVGSIFNGLFYYLFFYAIYKGIKNNLKEKK